MAEATLSSTSAAASPRSVTFRPGGETAFAAAAASPRTADNPCLRNVSRAARPAGRPARLFLHF